MRIYFSTDSSSPGDTIDLIRARAAYERARTRNAIAIVLIAAILIALGIAALAWMIDGTPNEISAIWAAVAVPMTWIFKAYYNPRQRGRGPL